MVDGEWRMNRRSLLGQVLINLLFIIIYGNVIVMSSLSWKPAASKRK